MALEQKQIFDLDENENIWLFNVPLPVEGSQGVYYSLLKHAFRPSRSFVTPIHQPWSLNPQ